MLKHMITDYMRAYRWMSLKEHLKTNLQLSFFAYWWFLALIGRFIFEKDSSNDYIAISAIYLPMIHIYTSGIIHPIKLSKMMYLCPMNAVERKNYVRNFYYFRVFLHMGISVAGIIILILSTRCNAVSAAAIACNDLTISLSAICRETSRNNTNDLPPRWGTNMAILLIALISNTAWLVAITDARPHVTLRFILLGILLFMQLPLSLSFHKYVKKELNAAANYEE